jgi:hypothetical protein
MARKIHSYWRLLLGSLITLLGFAACKTTKKVQTGSDTEKLYGPPPVIVTKQADDVVELYAAPPVLVEEQQPIDKVKPLYGPPPASKEKKLK